MPFRQRSRFEWKFGNRSLVLGERTQVIGILNVTPDSFSDGGRFSSLAAAIEGALAMLEQGAAIVDVGGESTRPGKRAQVTAAEEIDRVVPVIEGVLRSRPEAILSIDTYKAQTAEAALRAGALIVNDVSGLLWEPALAAICAAAGCGLVVMHTRGRPGEWRDLPRLAPAVLTAAVKSGLSTQVEAALAAGIRRDHLVIDPGFGFGKIGHENYALLAGLGGLLGLGQPLLAGVSRKSFVGRALAPLRGGEIAPTSARETASIAAATAAVLAGADLLRAHQVASTLEAAVIADAILDAAAEL